MIELIKKIESILKKKGIFFENISFLAGDASNRKYFEFFSESEKKIIMYDDKGKKSIDLFLKKTSILKDYKIKVPKIFNVFKEESLLIIEYFGEKKYSKILNKKNKKKLYKLAVDNLIYLHKFKPNKEFKSYTKQKFWKESKLFFSWYLVLKKKKIPPNELLEFKSLFFDFLTDLYILPQVNIHRDFHIDNLFFLSNQRGLKKCGWIDYQDAISGPCVYDLMSLLEDARVDSDSEVNDYLISYYLKHFKKIDKLLFEKTFKIIAIQRHLKVLGIFSRLYLRDNKPAYLSHIPRVEKMLKRNICFNQFKEINFFLNHFLKNKK